MAAAQRSGVLLFFFLPSPRGRLSSAVPSQDGEESGDLSGMAASPRRARPPQDGGRSRASFALAPPPPLWLDFRPCGGDPAADIAPSLSGLAPFRPSLPPREHACECGRGWLGAGGGGGGRPASPAAGGEGATAFPPSLPPSGRGSRVPPSPPSRLLRADGRLKMAAWRGEARREGEGRAAVAPSAAPPSADCQKSALLGSRRALTLEGASCGLWGGGGCGCSPGQLSLSGGWVGGVEQ